MSANPILWQAAVALLCICACAVAMRRPRYTRKPIMTANEAEFFGRLVRAVPHGYVFAQVAMSALLEPNGWHPGARLSAFRRISQKRVDYAVHDARLSLICVVELDDRTHVQARDRLRDGVLRAAGIQTLRFESKSKPSVEQIRFAIARLGVEVGAGGSSRAASR